jgi:hypothetical protein
MKQLQGQCSLSDKLVIKGESCFNESPTEITRDRH